MWFELLVVNHKWAHHNWMVTAGTDKHWMLISCNGDIKVTQVEDTKLIEVIKCAVAGQNCHRLTMLHFS